MKKKILLIDDDVELCEEMSDILKDEGYNVDLKHDGESGLKFAETGSYDIILLDLKLPKVSGIEILRKLKQKSLKSKIIVLTGKPFSKMLNLELGLIDDDDRYILENADGFINKPYDVNELLSEVKKLSTSS